METVVPSELSCVLYLPSLLGMYLISFIFCRFDSYCFLVKSAAQRAALLRKGRLLALLLLALALLVSDTAAGLASGLAGSLALAAATVLGAIAKIAGLKSFDVFHDEIPPQRFIVKIIAPFQGKVNMQ